MDSLRNRLKTNYIAVVASASVDRSNAFLIAAVSPDLTGRFNAGEIAKEIAGIVGGSGGGRPDMAQAGGKNVSKLPEALARVYGIVEKTRP
jgi:alanyl-tRNA synthetase